MRISLFNSSGVLRKAEKTLTGKSPDPHIRRRDLSHGNQRVSVLLTYLVPANNAFKDIEVTPEMDCEVWGVVNSVIRKLT